MNDMNHMVMRLEMNHQSEQNQAKKKKKLPENLYVSGFSTLFLIEKRSVIVSEINA